DLKSSSPSFRRGDFQQPKGWSSRNPVKYACEAHGTGFACFARVFDWIPAFAGMTSRDKLSLAPSIHSLPVSGPTRRHRRRRIGRISAPGLVRRRPHRKHQSGAVRDVRLAEPGFVPRLAVECGGLDVEVLRRVVARDDLE